jgi:thiol-disulfide isomerase/thioredoxin
MTGLKEGFKRLSFRLPAINRDGKSVSLDDPQFENKPVIIQIMASWCPNCLDESLYLNELYEQYQEQDLEIIGITFERAKDKATAYARAGKMIDDLSIPYDVLLGTATRDNDPNIVLSMLEDIKSYPTTIYLNRDHEVVKIYTGFTGPSTPVYEQFVQENDAFIQKLIE